MDNSLATLLQYPAGLGAKNYVLPGSVMVIGEFAFDGCFRLASVTIPKSVAMINQFAFLACPNLKVAYFQGNAPSVDGQPGNLDGTVFESEAGVAFVLPGTAGWGTSFGGWPTTVWSPPELKILGGQTGPRRPHRSMG